jgi:hypothetical protein
LEDAVDIGEGGADEELDATFRDVNGVFGGEFGLLWRRREAARRGKEIATKARAIS